MSEQPRIVLHGFWGERAMSPTETAKRIKASFDTLSHLGEPLRGPWAANYTKPLDNTDEAALLRHVLASPVKDDAGNLTPEDGFDPRFHLGNWGLPAAVAKDLGAFKISVSPHESMNRMTSSVILTFDGRGFVDPAREHARTLVKGFTRAWQPDYLAFTDHELLDQRGARIGRSLSGRPLPSWGYVAWLSDVVSRHVETVEGATTERFGPGTLITTDSRDPEQAADVWRGLLDTKRLRPAPSAQEHLPEFP